MSETFPKPVERLIRELSRLPTIGRKSAQRLALHILKGPADQAAALADSLAQLHARVHFCSRCFYLAEGDLCAICSDPARDPNTICVVEEPQDVAALQKSGRYRGHYHVLLGSLSPLHGVMADDLKIAELLTRLSALDPARTEVILATNPDVDGDATALYLSRSIEPMGIKVTRLGLGLPIGGSLEHADELTLAQAFEGRRSV